GARAPPDPRPRGSCGRDSSDHPRPRSSRPDTGSRMTARGPGVLVLAAAACLSAWAFGATVVFPAAIGLGLVVGLGWAWVRVLRRPIELRRSLGAAEQVGGAVPAWL